MKGIACLAYGKGGYCPECQYFAGRDIEGEYMCNTRAVALDAIRELESLKKPDTVTVVRCRDCRKGIVWKDGHSFTCHENELDYYAPHYDADTFFCADGERRE